MGEHPMVVFFQLHWRRMVVAWCWSSSLGERPWSWSFVVWATPDPMPSVGTLVTQQTNKQTRRCVRLETAGIPLNFTSNFTHKTANLPETPPISPCFCAGGIVTVTHTPPEYEGADGWGSPERTPSVLFCVLTPLYPGLNSTETHFLMLTKGCGRLYWK
jgi:hypothetical protein